MMRQAKPLLCAQRKADVKFYPSGRIDINSNVTKMLNLEDGDAINILDSGNGEYYLYPSIKKSNFKVTNAKFVNAVHRAKSYGNTCRCQCKQLTDAVSILTGASESWLFVGNPRDLSDLGINAVGVPLIYKNNQYKPIPESGD